MAGISKRVSGSWVSGDYGIMKTATDTITTLPAVIYPNASTVTVGLKGNTVQNGTPTPDSPIMPQGCGERTGNLINVQPFTIEGDSTSHNIVLWSGTLPVGTYTIHLNQDNTLTTALRNTIRLVIGGTTYYESANENYHLQSGQHKMTFSVSDATQTIEIRYWGNTLSNDCSYSNIMLNTGSTAKPYEPYGYKIPISMGGTTTPVYLGEVQSTRRIGKIDLSELSWRMIINGLWATTDIPNIKYVSANTELGDGIAEKYTIHTGSGMSTALNCIAIDVSQVSVNTGSTSKKPTGMFWYALATEETAIVNEPLMKIGDYADSLSTTIPCTAGENTLDVQTTVHPSEVTAGFSGWHPVTDVHERENGQWD